MTRKLEVFFWEEQIIYQRRRAVIMVKDGITNEQVLKFGKECIEDAIVEWINVVDTEYGDVIDIEDLQIAGEVEDD